MFDYVPEPLLAALLAGLFLAATELGYRRGLRWRAKKDERIERHTSALQGSLLGLLSLILGFTLSMAVSRFETRKALVVSEANAISTSYLRADFLPTEQAAEARALLRRYVDNQLAFVEAANDQPRTDAVIAETTTLQQQLWAVAKSGMPAASIPAAAGLFVSALNEVLDLHEKRLRALEDHVPDSVIVLGCLVAVAAFGFIGFDCGLGGARRLASVGIVASVVALVLMVVIDLDQPRRGMVRVSQHAMVELKATLARQH